MSRPARGGEDAGAEVAGGELTQLPGEDGDGERGQFGPQQRDAVALQEGADGVQPLLHGGGHGPRVHHDHMPVLLDEGLHGGEGLLQRLPVEVGEDGGGQGALVLGGSARSAPVTAMAVGTRSSPIPAVRPTGVTPVRRGDFIA